jgi:hypothetical protein
METKLTRIAAVLGMVAAVTAGACRQPAPAPPATAAGVPLPAGVAEAAEAIAAPDLLRDVTELSSDAMEGRLPGSAGDARARAYLAARLGELGLEPAFGADGWEQPITIVGATSRLPEAWAFQAPGGGREAFRFGDEYTGASGVQQPQVSIEHAEVVFVGYGIQAPEEGGRLKGRRTWRQGPAMLNDDLDWDGAVRRRAQASRPLDLQVQAPRARARPRHHHTASPPVARGWWTSGRRAVRAPAMTAADPLKAAGRAPPAAWSRSPATTSTCSSSRPARRASPRLPSGSRPRCALPSSCRQAPPPTSAGCCAAPTPSSPTSWS